MVPQACAQSAKETNSASESAPIARSADRSPGSAISAGESMVAGLSYEPSGVNEASVAFAAARSSLPSGKTAAQTSATDLGPSAITADRN